LHRKSGAMISVQPSLCNRPFPLCLSWPRFRFRCRSSIWRKYPVFWRDRRIWCSRRQSKV